MRDNVRRIWALRGNAKDGYYIKKLYINSEYKFDAASPTFEKAMQNFKRAVKKKLPIPKRQQPTRNV